MSFHAKRAWTAAEIFLITVLILASFIPARALAQATDPGSPSTPPVGAPTLSLQAAGATSVTAAWTAVEGATGYALYRYDTEWTQVGGTLTATTHTDTGLTTGQTYYYAVAAVNAAGRGPWSESVPITLSSSAQTPPAGAPTLSVQAAGATSVTAAWTAVEGATGYALYRYDTEWTQIGGGTLTATTYTDSGLTTGQTYYYAVAAVNAAGRGPWSERVPVTPAPPADNMDRAALEALYNAANGPNWTNNSDWLSDRPLGEWHGVSTDANGRVTSLDLIDNQLSGTIPPQLGNLANLTHLNLNSNQLSGEIPSQLGNLSNLTLLYLWDNQLSGEIPVQLGSLSRLTYLALGENQLSGSIPSQLGNLANLIHLNLNSNQLSGSIPSELGNLSNLTDLWLNWNQLSGEIPSELSNLSNLEDLSLRGNQLSGEIPSALGNLSNLTHLYLAGNQLSGCIPAVWRNVQNNDLAQLSLQFCTAATPPASAPTLSVQAAGATSITAAWTAVESATGYALYRYDTAWTQVGGGTLTATTYTDTGLTTGQTYYYAVAAVNAAGRGPWSASVPVTPAPPADNMDRAALEALYNAANGANWTNSANWLSDRPLGEWHGVTTDSNGRVTRLELPLNQLSGSIPSELGDLTNLAWLFLRDNQLRGSIPSELGNLINLTELVLNSNQLSGEIPSELGNLTNLKILQLFNNQLSGTIPSALGNLSNLTHLILHTNQLSGAIPSALGNLTNLTWLYLAGNQLSGCIPAVWRNVKNNDLAQLNLQFCSASTPPAGAPTLSVQAAGATSVTAAWTKVAGATGYALYRYDSAWTQVGGGTLTATTYTDTGLTTGQTYYYAVAAINAAGRGPWSESVPVTPAPPANTDRAALVALYNATNGANWTNSANWLSNRPLGAWHGVTTDADRRVTALNLRANGLSGSIPSELGNLTNLTHLYLVGNQLSGCIPAALQNVQSNDLDQLGLPFCLHGVYRDWTVPYVIWDVGPNASQNVFDETRRGIVMMHEYASSLGGLPAVTRPVTVFLYHDDWDALAPKYARLKGISTSDALVHLTTYIDPHGQRVAEVGVDYLVLFSANLSRKSPGIQRWIAAHELVHNYQNWNSWWISGAGVPDDYDWSQVHLGLGPVWLFEGCADFQGRQGFRRRRSDPIRSESGIDRARSAECVSTPERP